MRVSQVLRIVLVSILCAKANVASATLLGYYGLNETAFTSGVTVAVDSSPSGSRSGTYLIDSGSGPTSIPSVNAGLYGTAVDFDFSSSLAYINTPFSGAPSQNSALTYAAWINPDALQMGIPNIIASSSGSRGYDFRLSLPTGGDGSVWNLSLNTGGATVPAAANYITTATIPAGAWTHVAFTKDVNETGSAGAGTNTSALKFYMNGSLVESGDISQPGITTASRYLFAAGRSGTSYYSGGIDEVRIYDEVLDATAIAALAAGLPAAPGDFNNDHKVNAADYVLWRKNPASFLPSTYDTWRANFGNPPGSGSGLGDAGSVPEPTCGLLLSLVVCAWGARRSRSF